MRGPRPPVFKGQALIHQLISRMWENYKQDKNTEGILGSRLTRSWASERM